jgi:hypothetical protein
LRSYLRSCDSTIGDGCTKQLPTSDKRPSSCGPWASSLPPTGTLRAGVGRTRARSSRRGTAPAFDRAYRPGHHGHELWRRHLETILGVSRVRRVTTIRRSCSRRSRKCLGYLAERDAEGGGRILVGSGSAGFATRVDDSPDDNDDDSRASRHLHLHDNRTRIVPGRVIGLCLRIRRLGVRIPSGARRSEALSIIVEGPLLLVDDTFDDLTDG